MAVEAAVDTLGEQQFPSIYGDIAIINNHTQIAVYLTTPTPAIDAAFQALAPAGTLVFRSTPRSLQALNQVHRTVEDQADALIDQGIRLSEIGPNILIGKEDIAVVNLTPDEKQTLDDQFGADAINVFNVTPDEATIVSESGRNDDGPAPYNGGDAITDLSHLCTSGYGIQISGQNRLISAGHCWAGTGDTIYNQKWNGSNWIGGGGRMGSVTHDGLAWQPPPQGYYEGTDSSVITGCDGGGSCGGSKAIWLGQLGSSYTQTVADIGTWHVGDTVCESGAYGGEVCGMTVQQINYDIWADNYLHLYHHITRAFTSGDLPVDGDSGGPVFSPTGGIHAVGTQTAINTVYGYDFFTGISAILTAWNACLRSAAGCVT
jgi:hypothetical protein